jgi:hypothetical protein
MISTYELSVTNTSELEKKLIQFPVNSKIHLPDKPNFYLNLELAKLIQNRKLGITFSIANHYYGGQLHLIIAYLNKYLLQIQNQLNISELLIVSGPNSRKINTLTILEYLQTYLFNYINRQDIIISVAYNCQCENQEIENNRLKAKLFFSIVKKVYIQITDDISKIKTAIKNIKSINPEIIICICIFNPSKLGLSNFKFRLWKGVVLS